MNYKLKPSERDVREARSLAKGVVETCRIVEEIDELNIELGWTSEEFILEELNGCQEFAKSGNTVKLGFNTSVDGWKESLRFNTGVGYGKAFFLNSKNFSNEEIDFLWEKLLFEGFGLVFANEALGEIENKAPYNLGNFEDEELENLWRIFSENLEKSMKDDPESIDPEVLNDRNIEKIGFLISKELAKNYSWNELSKLKKVRLIEAGEKLFI